MNNKRVLIQRVLLRRNLSIEESNHFIKSYPYNRRKNMITDEYFNTIECIYI